MMMDLSRVASVFGLTHLRFAALCAFAILMLWIPLQVLLGLSLHDGRYAHILVAPVISAAFLYLERGPIFRDSRYCPAAGFPLVVLGLLLALVSRVWPVLSGNVYLASGALLILWIGAFVLCYGVTSLRRASFSLLLLVLIVPIPAMAMDRMVTALQVGSAEVSYLLFRVAGIPAFRHEMIISLPGVDIDVAPQCSGIRSSMAFLVVGAMLSRVLLGTSWARILVMLCIGPVAIFRNAVRIVCISLLGVYVDRGFFSGNLHRHGGLPFSLVGFVILIPLIWSLRRWERHVGRGRLGVARAGLSSGPVPLPSELKA
jgi:exosortase